MQHACQYTRQMPEERGVGCEQLNVDELRPRDILQQTDRLASGSCFLVLLLQVKFTT